MHFNGEARAALRELRGEWDFRGFAIGFFFQDFFHGRLRQRRKIKLHATRHDGRQKRVRRGRGEYERRRAGRLLENFQEDVGDIPAHGLRAVEDEDAAPAHGLKVGGTLDGAQLADTQHRARYRALQADRVGYEGPYVRVRLQDQRHALDGRGVSILATLGKSLLEQRLWIGEQGDAPASGALAAEVVGEAFAIRGLCKHPRESEFAHATCAGEEQCMGDTISAESAAERRDDAFVAEKFEKTQALALLTRGSRGKHSLDSGENIHGNLFRFANGVECGIETLDGRPGRAARKRVVHFGGILEVTKAGLEQIFLGRGVGARRLALDQPLRFSRRHAKVEDETFAGKAVNAVLEMLDPFQKSGTLLRGDTSGLVSEDGTDVAVHKNNLAAVQG